MRKYENISHWKKEYLHITWSFNGKEIIFEWSIHNTKLTNYCMYGMQEILIWNSIWSQEMRNKKIYVEEINFFLIYNK